MTAIEYCSTPKKLTEQEIVTDSGLKITLALEQADSLERSHIGCLVVGGFMSNADTNSAFRNAFVGEAGIDTATMDYSEVPIADSLKTNKVRIEDVEAAIRALAHIKEEIIIVAHSMGAAIALDTLCQLNINLFKKIKAVVMVNGAGLIDDEGIDEILPRVAKQYQEGKENGKGFGETMKGKNKTFRAMAARIIRLAADGINALRNKSFEEVSELAKRGVPILNIVSQYDGLFPDELVNESVKDLPIYAQASIIGASHFTPSEEPVKLAIAVKGMLRGL